MEPLSRRLRPHITVSKSGTSLPDFLVSSLRSARAVRALAINVPALGPRPLFCSIRFFRGTCFDRKSTSGSTVFKPKALSERSTVCRFGSSRRAVRRDESAGGISKSRRDVNMSSSLAVCRVVFFLSTEARVSQAGAPSVLPPRWISVTVSEAIKGLRCGSMCSAVSSLRDWHDREKMLDDDIVSNGGSLYSGSGDAFFTFVLCEVKKACP